MFNQHADGADASDASCNGCGDCESCAMPCDACGKWECECCATCGGDGWLYALPLNVSPAQSPISCDQCNGTGRAKAVA